MMYLIRIFTRNYNFGRIKNTTLVNRHVTDNHVVSSFLKEVRGIFFKSKPNLNYNYQFPIHLVPNVIPSVANQSIFFSIFI